MQMIPEFWEKSAVRSERLKFRGICPNKPNAEVSASTRSLRDWLLESLLKDAMGASPTVDCASPPYMYGAQFEYAVSDLIIPCIKGIFVACTESEFGGGSTLLEWVEKSTEEGIFVLIAEPPLRYGLDRLGED